ncbi:MAG TPA: phosphonatase-like hydrolase [Urbifossiella sp.]|nr:phosphonatase-like hydrolase [Urbifossiella sp.]
MTELVVFDMAGTTVHDGDGVNAAFRAALAGHGVAADPAVIDRVMGYYKPEAIRIILDTVGRPATAAEVDMIHTDFVARMKDYYATNPDVRPIPGAVEGFARLRAAGVKVALNTGFGRAIADAVLARLGWSVPGVVDATIASDEAPRGRPHPDMIRALMERLGVRDPRAVVKVGDTTVDMEEGTNVGCGKVVGVTTGAFTWEQLATRPHTHIVASVADVPSLVLGGA